MVLVMIYLNIYLMVWSRDYMNHVMLDLIKLMLIIKLDDEEHVKFGWNINIIIIIIINIDILILFICINM